MNPTLEQTVILRPKAEESRSFASLRMTPFFLMALVFLASCAFRGSESFYFGHYSEAEQLYGKGQYEKAILKYQAYIDENPEGNLAVISQYYMAKSHAALGHTVEAKALYENIVQKYPDLVWANFSKTQLKELEGAASPATTAPPPAENKPTT